MPDIPQSIASFPAPSVAHIAAELYFPLEDAQYEAAFIPRGTLIPIPSLWGHPAGAGASPAENTFLSEWIAAFLAE